ncbi:hypothetical protein AB0L10_43875, partial [Streptomyces flaveolus]|uniref:hypothetical protein n=1 Tax=Streptomyces flaveolus TaxID=67297 RepID=UPI00342280AA
RRGADRVPRWQEAARMPPPYSHRSAGDVVKVAGYPAVTSASSYLLGPGIEAMAERGGSRRQLLK